MFSVIDFNSSSGINKAEFTIGLRALFIGVHHAFQNSSPPSLKSVEGMAERVFKQIDKDHSETVMLHEITSYAYRETHLRDMFAPFVSKDKRVFEELICFGLPDA